MEDYYVKQESSGLADGTASGIPNAFGANRHLGRGFFTSALGLMSRALPFLGRSLLNTAVNVADEFRSNGESETSVKDALKKSAIAAIDQGVDKVKMVARRKIMGAGRARSGHACKSGGSKATSKKIGGKRSRRRRRKTTSVKGQGRKSKRARFTPHLW